MMRHYLISLFALAALAIALPACSSDDDKKGGDNGGDEKIDVRQVAIDSTSLSEAAEVIPAETDPDGNDYVENSSFDRVVTITYNGNTATATGDVSYITISTTGAHVTVNSTRKSMHYILKGSSSNGSFKVYSENKYELELAGVSLTNPTGAAINNQCGKSLYLVLASGTSNSLTDGSSYTTTVGEDMKGTLFSEGQILFSGTGSLNVYANCRNGIASDDYIRFRPGAKFYVRATAGNGIKANDGIIIGGSVINVEATAAGAKGINCDAGVAISGGRTTLITSGNSEVAQLDTTSCAALKCDSLFTMTAGTLNLKSTGEGGKGLNCNFNINITGGNITSVTTGVKGNAAPKGIKADGDISITGGKVYSYSARSKPIEAGKTLTVGTTAKVNTSTSRLFQVEF